MTGEPTKMDAENLAGVENTLIRYYFYLNAGLNVLNQSRNLFLAIFAIYIALHFEAWWMLIVMFVPSVILLTIGGWWSVHHANRLMEWLSIRFSTHYAIRQYELQEEIRDTLKEIRDKMFP